MGRWRITDTMNGCVLQETGVEPTATNQVLAHALPSLLVLTLSLRCLEDAFLLRTRSSCNSLSKQSEPRSSWLCL